MVLWLTRYISGLIQTPLVEHLTEQQKVRVAEKNTMGRAGRPDEVATMILYLLSDESSFCNGSVSCLWLQLHSLDCFSVIKNLYC